MNVAINRLFHPASKLEHVNQSSNSTSWCHGDADESSVILPESAKCALKSEVSHCAPMVMDSVGKKMARTVLSWAKQVQFVTVCDFHVLELRVFQRPRLPHSGDSQAAEVSPHC